MILMHAMEAPRAIPGIGIARGDTMYHLLSDIPGPAGTAELLAFVRACGGRDAWIQSAGTYREHFDIFGEFADMAVALGATPATNATVAAVLTRKRQQQGDARMPVAALTTRQKHAVWQLLERQLGITPAQLASRAAPHVVTLARHLLGGALAHKRVTLLLGTSADLLGAASAHDLAAAGADVTLLRIGDAPTITAAPTAPHMTTITCPELNTADLRDADILIDRLLPWGDATPPTAAIARAIAVVNDAPTPTLALDAPSGLDNDPDEYRRYIPWLRATATLALGVPLRGLTLTDALPVIGALWLADVGIPRRVLKQVGARLGPIFATQDLVRLEAVPLRDGGEIVRWVVAA